MMSNGLGVLSKPTADVSPEATETVGCSLSMICRQKWFTAVPGGKDEVTAGVLDGSVS